MVLKTIYVVRHGFRMNWVVDPTTGTYNTSTPTPTGIPSDPALAAYGVSQARQLASKIRTLDPPVDIIYSSPFYRCLQTIQPTVEALTSQHQTDGRVRVEPGISEFFGTARFTHPAAPSLSLLTPHFPFLHPSHNIAIQPNPTGETIPALHDRHAYALHRIIADLDAAPDAPNTLLLCTHAASMICIGRALTGRMPEDPDEDDFRCGTCALSTYVRRGSTPQAVEPWKEGDAIPETGWRGKGVQGGWECVGNGDCSFLDRGEERSWKCSMEALHPDNVPNVEVEVVEKKNAG